MDTTGIADPENTFIPSPKLHEYMNDYAAKFGIADKVRFNSRVSKIERRTGGGGWDIWLQDTDEPLGFDKVIVATGLTSNPNIPNLETVDFTPPTFHTMELGERLEWIRRDEVETVTVYGGGKSAVDAVYTCAKMGKRVDWVIRPDGVGNGVPCLIPPTVLGQSGSAVGSSRFGQMQHPCLDTRGDWWYRFLHSGKGLGYWLHWKASILNRSSCAWFAEWQAIVVGLSVECYAAACWL
jgi:dimethylaniline monooxygenase (N-oxide forming)